MEILQVDSAVTCSFAGKKQTAFGMGNDVVIYRTSNTVGMVEIARMTFEERVWSVIISPCERFVVAGLENGLIDMRSILGTEITRDFTGHTGLVRGLIFSPCGILLISGCFDSTVKVWNWADGTCLSTTACGSPVSALTLLFRGHEILAGTWNGTLTVIGMNGKLYREVRIEGEVKVSALACFDDKVVTGLGDGHLQLRNASNLDVIWSNRVHQELISSVDVSPNKAYIVTTCDNFTLAIVNLESIILSIQSNCSRAAHFTHDGSKITFGGTGRSIITLDLFPRSRKILLLAMSEFNFNILGYQGEEVARELYARLKQNLFSGPFY